MAVSLDIESLTKTYPGPAEALNAVTLGVRAGELVAVVGPSGCGKTTLLRLVAGLERPTSGRVLFDGRDVGSVPPGRRGVGMVFHDAGLYPHLDVRGNLAFGPRIRGEPRAEIPERVREAAELLGIADLLPRRPATLSAGEARRVALARTVLRRPSIVLLDEPLANLDAPVRQDLRRRLRQILDRLGVTTLLVTHDQEEAMALGDRVAILESGRLRQVGTPEEVHDRPADRFVGGFIGSLPMNLLPGRLVRDGSGLTFESGAVTVRIPEDLGAGIAPSTSECILGFRPQHAELLSGDAASGAPVLRGAVERREVLGEGVALHLSTEDGVRLIATADRSRAPVAGMPAAVRLDPRRVHLFAADARGRNLREGAP